MEFTNGKMVGPTLANGKITTCTDRVSTLGLMVGAMKDSMKWIKNMAMVSIPGLMVEFTKDLG